MWSATAAGRGPGADPDAGQSPGLGAPQDARRDRVVGAGHDDDDVTGPGHEPEPVEQRRAVDRHRRAAPACRRSPGARTRPRRGGRARATGRDAPHRGSRRRSAGRASSAAAARSPARSASRRSEPRSSFTPPLTRLVTGGLDRLGHDSVGVRGHEHLAQREAAVVGRDDAVGQHVEAVRGEAFGACRRSSSDVLEHAAREPDPLDAGRRSRGDPGDGDDRVGHRGVEPGRDRPDSSRRARRSATIARSTGRRVDASWRRCTGRRHRRRTPAPVRCRVPRAPRARSPPRPRTTRCGGRRASELTASNSRPMLDVGMQSNPLESCRRSVSSSAGAVAPTGGRSGSHAIPAARRCASATRDGLADRRITAG